MNGYPRPHLHIQIVQFGVSRLPDRTLRRHLFIYHLDRIRERFTSSAPNWLGVDGRNLDRMRRKNWL